MKCTECGVVQQPADRLFISAGMLALLVAHQNTLNNICLAQSRRQQ